MIRLAAIDNIWVKEILLEKAGDVHPGHRHVFAHPTLLAAGAVRLEVEGEPVREVRARTILYIAKEKIHTMTALEPNTLLYCIHALRFGDGVGDIFAPDDPDIPTMALPLIHGERHADAPLVSEPLPVIGKDMR